MIVGEVIVKSPQRSGPGHARDGARERLRGDDVAGDQYSSKGGAVETGCSGLHYIIGYFMI